MKSDNKYLTKSELLTKVKEGILPDEYVPFDIGQGYGYKIDKLWNEVASDIVIYIPEYGYSDDEKCMPKESCIYTKEDFLNVTEGNEKLAEELFYEVDWSFPETLWDEWKEFADW